mmetsp:Transcript_68505/g.107797  ORF Transcript_68505/g.107797 Transcript_68505/m.107797 type:complete len:174 (+) Transcript_68505:46-567(+)
MMQLVFTIFFLLNDAARASSTCDGGAECPAKATALLQAKASSHAMTAETPEAPFLGAALRALQQRSNSKSHRHDRHDRQGDVEVAKEGSGHATGDGQGDRQGSDDQIRELFDLFDIDKSGRIKAWEMQDVISGLGFQAPMEMCEEMIHYGDLDHDGTLAYWEFKQEAFLANLR